MLYPAKWKKITVDQSKVLKNWLFRFWGATRYICMEVFIIHSHHSHYHNYMYNGNIHICSSIFLINNEGMGRSVEGGSTFQIFHWNQKDNVQVWSSFLCWCSTCIFNNNQLSNKFFAVNRMTERARWLTLWARCSTSILRVPSVFVFSPSLVLRPTEIWRAKIPTKFEIMA